MDELIERLKEFQAKEGVELKACTIVLKEKDKWKNYLITTDTWGELYVEDIP